jgi:chromate reductase
MTVKKVGVLVGSLRRESWSRKIAKAMMLQSPASMVMEGVAIDDLPIYNQDWDDTGYPPQPWTALREKIKSYDAFVFVTPEYNRSVPAVLKNALDVASRPHVKNAWSGKPGGVISVSPGSIGGFGANYHIKQTLACLNVAVMPQPEAYIGNASSLFDADGVLTDSHTLGLLKKFLAAFAVWIEKNA